jgi:simple sugar transport system substrate-binding protein/basic membrane protein A
MNRDQNSVAPDVILGSAVILIPQAFQEVALAWQAGGLGGRPIYEGLVEGVIDFVPNPELRAVTPVSVLAAIDVARERIRAGDLIVPRVPFVEGEPGVDSEPVVR